jgi:hypothetical protein
MIAVKIALVILGLVPLCLGVMVLLTIPSSRSLARRLKELEDFGIETEAQVVSLRPGNEGSPRAHATLVVEVSGGDSVRKAHWVPLTPLLVVGGSYPIVRHHQFPGEFEPGTKAGLARKRQHEETVAIPHHRNYVIATVMLGAGLIAAGILL